MCLGWNLMQTFGTYKIIMKKNFPKLDENHRRRINMYATAGTVAWRSRLHKMGNKVATFTEDQYEEYQDCTFFTRKEIKRVYKKYREINPTLVPKVMTGPEPENVTVPCEQVARMPELRENPFRHRICSVFSRDGDGISFEDFLDMLSAFSEQAPREIKVHYAFRVYDFDEDEFLGTQDLEKAVQLLTRDELTADEISLVCTKVLEEGDVDDDGKLSFGEFEHVITRAPEFLSTFHIRI